MVCSVTHGALLYVQARSIIIALLLKELFWWCSNLQVVWMDFSSTDADTVERITLNVRAEGAEA